MTLPELSIRRPVFAWMMMAALIIFGIISFRMMGVSQMPSVDFPVISVTLSWEGAAPEVMETDVVDVVEGAFMNIQGLRDISSSVRLGQASITIELELDRDIDVAVQEVQTKIAQAQRLLPKDIDPPIIAKVNPEDQPIIWIALSGDVPMRVLTDYIQNYLQDQFTTISGVGEVFLGGFTDRSLRVWIDQKKLEAYQLTVHDVIAAIQSEHAEMPAGRIETAQTEQNIRAMGEAINVEEFGSIIISRRGGQPIYKPISLKEVAVIEDGLADVRRISRSMGKPTIGLGIRKQRGSNEVEVARRVLKRLKEIKRQVPQGMEVNVVVNRTKFIEDSINELVFTLFLSALFTSLICWLFFGSWTATVNILLAIPTSILGALIVVHFLNFTLNTFTVLGLSLAIGIVVDDAIMVLENIVRYRENGVEKMQAARQGAEQIMFAAVASTAAIVAIFIPVVFMSGVMGKFFFEYGVTISVAVLLSLFEAITLTPMRCSQFLAVGKRHSAFGSLIDTSFRRLAESYQKLLGRILERQGRVVLAALALFFASLSLILLLRKEFVPPQDQSMFFCRLQTPVGSSIEFTDSRFRQAEKFVMSRPEVVRYFAAIGGFTGGEVNSGILLVTLKEPRRRPVVAPAKKPLSQQELMGVFRKELNAIPDFKAVIQDMSLSGFSAQRGFPIEMTIRGPDWNKLAEYSDAIRQRMAKSALMIDVDTDYRAEVSEIRVYPDRQKAAQYDVNISTIGEAINALVGGERVAKYTQGGRRYDVRVRLAAGQRSQPQDIAQIWVWNNRGELVQLKDVVTITEKPTPVSITRRGRERAISISANAARGQSQAAAIEEAKRIAKEALPEGYRAVFGGNTQTFSESFQSLSFALWLGVLVAYMVLASQFNSFVHPLSVLVALPFSVSGALVALLLGGQSLNLYSIIGILLLMGIVKKNSILLVNFTNELRQQGLPLKEALLKACPIRLRPILMTSLATIAAALPPALAWGPGAEVRVPMATAVIGGVILSTLFTLLVVPCVYSLLTRLEPTVRPSATRSPSAHSNTSNN